MNRQLRQLQRCRYRQSEYQNGSYSRQVELLVGVNVGVRCGRQSLCNVNRLSFLDRLKHLQIGQSQDWHFVRILIQHNKVGQLP